MLVIKREMLTQHLLELPSLANAYAEHDAWFVDRVLAWFKTVEETLLRLRHPMTGFVSVQRSKVLAARDGYREPEISAQQLNRRQVERAAAVAAMGKVEAGVDKIVREVDTRLDELREKMAQLLAVASAAKPIPLPDGQGRDDWLRAIWANLAAIAESRSMYGYLNAAAPRNDIIVVLGDVLDNLLAQTVVVD